MVAKAQAEIPVLAATLARAVIMAQAGTVATRAVILAQAGTVATRAVGMMAGTVAVLGTS
jgi:hypothetical protein